MQRPPCASISCYNFSDSSTSGKKNTKIVENLRKKTNRFYVIVLTEGHSTYHRHMLGEEDRVCYLNHVHILAAFLEGPIVIRALLILLIAEVLITGLLVEQFVVQLVRVFTLLLCPPHMIILFCLWHLGFMNDLLFWLQIMPSYSILDYWLIFAQLLCK